MREGTNKAERTGKGASEGSDDNLMLLHRELLILCILFLESCLHLKNESCPPKD